MKPLTLPEILALRPADNTTAAIKAALARAKSARDEALNHAETLEKSAARALLTASDDELLSKERDAALARLSADRISALLPELEEMLPAAERRESVEHITALADRSNSLGEACAAAWRDYPAIVAPLVALLTQTREADAAWHAARAALDGAYRSRRDWQPGEIPSAVNLPAHRAMFTGLHVHPVDAIQLPATEPGPAIWTGPSGLTALR